MDLRYKQEVAKYGKKDGIIALCLYVYIIAAHFIPRILPQGLANLIAGLPWMAEAFIITFVLFTVPCIILVLARKQGLASIGFHTKNLLPSLRIGLVFSALTLILFGNLIPGLVQGWELKSFGTLVNALLITLIFASWEDIVMMGYIQTRIYGLIKNNVLAVVMVAFLFALVHIPMRLAVDGLAAFDIGLLLLIIGWMGNFIAWNLIFRRHFSIYPVIMLHVFMNFSPDIWYSRGQGLDFNIASVILWVAIYGWAWVSYRSYRKKSAEQMS